MIGTGGGAGPLTQILEPAHVHPVGLDVQAVPTGSTLQQDWWRLDGCGLFQQPADAGEVDVQGPPGARRRDVPDPVDQLLSGYQPSGVDRQRGNHQTRLRPTGI
jgi:hypothetical protein